MIDDIGAFEETIMSKLLHLDSSGRGSLSITQPLTAHFASKWKESNPGGQVIHRDLAESDLQFVNAELVAAFNTPQDQLTQQQKDLMAQSNSLVSELYDADVYVFGVPMYNFSIPALFKAYIDLIVRAGKTFSYEGGRPNGLLKNKKLYVVTASGGDYRAEPMKSLDFLEPYVRTILNFIGIADITFIKAYGHDAETVSATTKAAKDSIDTIFRTVGASAHQ